MIGWRHKPIVKMKREQKEIPHKEGFAKSEKLFRSMIEKSADMITLALPEGKLLYVSPSLTDILGFTLEEYQSIPAFKFIHPEDVQGMMEQMEGIIEHPGRSFFRQQRLLRKDGTYLWCEGTVTNMLNDPDIGALISNFRDITERKEAEAKLSEKVSYIEKRTNEFSEVLLRYTLMDFTEKVSIGKAGDEMDAIAVGLNTLGEELESYILQLKKSNAFLNAILENIPNMVFAKDAHDLRFVQFNKAGEKLLGMSKDQLLGKNDNDLFPKEQADFFIGKDKEVLAKKQLLDIPEEPIDTHEGKRWLHTQKIPILDEEGNALYLMGISEDITQRRERENEIRKLNVELENHLHRLEAVNKELESFSYSVSHDLRAPLRAINGYAQMLNEDHGAKLDAEGKRVLQIIRFNATKMGTLIDDLLAFSRLGRKEIQKKTVDMNELAEGVLREFNRSVTHQAEITIGNLHPVKCDYGLIHQVLFNLLSNAVKYSSKKERPQVSVTSEEKNGEVIFSVKDNGAGFNMNYYNKLFGVFQRLHTQDEFEGTGVGLAIVQRIIAKHGGKVWAEGKLNGGAAFHFTLTNN